MNDTVSDNEKLLQFALQKLGVNKEELEKEMTNEQQATQDVKELVRLSDDFAAYCKSFNTTCSGCQVKRFKNKYCSFGQMECSLVFNYLMEKEQI